MDEEKTETFEEKCQQKIEKFIEQEEFDKAQKLTEVLKTHAEVLKTRAEAHKATVEAEKAQTEKNAVIADRKIAIINSVIQGGNLLMTIFGYGMRDRWIRMGFKFESTGSISGVTTKQVYLPGKI